VKEIASGRENMRNKSAHATLAPYASVA